MAVLGQVPRIRRSHWAQMSSSGDRQAVMGTVLLFLIGNMSSDRGQAALGAPRAGMNHSGADRACNPLSQCLNNSKSCPPMEQGRKKGTALTIQTRSVAQLIENHAAANANALTMLSNNAFGFSQLSNQW